MAPPFPAGSQALRAALLLLLGPLRLPGAEGSDSVVLTLNTASFDHAVKANALMLVQFHAPWCGHCKQLEPEFEKAATALHGRVAFARVDATVEVGLADRYKVDGYPLLYFFNRGKAEEYNGGRVNSTIVQWLQDHSGPALLLVPSQAELQKQLALRSPSAAAFVALGGASLLELFQRLAEGHRLLGSFFFMERLPPATPCVQVHRGVADLVELSGEAETADAQGVLRFLQEHMLPMWGEINEDNYQVYVTRALRGLLWVCFRPATFKEDAVRHGDVFREVAAGLPGIPVVYIDTGAYEEHVHQELGCTEFPMAVLQVGNLSSQDMVVPRRYSLRLQESSLSAATVSAWLVEVLAGKVEEDDDLDSAADGGLEEEEEDAIDYGEEEDEEEEEEGAGPLPGAAGGGEL